MQTLGFFLPLWPPEDWMSNWPQSRVGGGKVTTSSDLKITRKTDFYSTLPKAPLATLGRHSSVSVCPLLLNSQVLITPSKFLGRTQSRCLQFTPLSSTPVHCA